MDNSIRVLIVEDSEDDAELMLHELRHHGFDLVSTRVENRTEMRVALEDQDWDIILSDFRLPRFSGLAALEVLKATGKDVPFIVVSRVLGTAGAADLMKSGVQDFVQKDDLARLVPAVERELEQAETRRKHREAEEALRLTQFSVDHSNEALFWITPDARFFYVNDAACEGLGYSREEMLSMSVMDIGPDWPEERWPGHWEELKAVGVLRFETTHRRKDGTMFPVEVTANFLEYEGKEYNFAFVRDITKRKLAEEHLLRAQKMEAIGVLAGGVAHDFNNFLTGILGHAFLALEQLAEEDPVRRDLEQIELAGNRAKSLVKQLLAFSGRRKGNPQPVRLHRVVEEVLQLISASVPSTIEVRHGIDERSSVVMADPTQLHQVLVNLCTNAVHAIGEGTGRIEIGLEDFDASDRSIASGLGLPPGRYARLTVADTGRGMDDKIIEHIFDPFFTTKPANVGTGLGLAAVHGIVSDHEGHIRVESKPGEGTTFSLFFPVTDKEESLSDQPVEAALTGKERILLVDDEEMIVQMMDKLLSHLGYKVDSATSGEQALEVFRSAPDRFDLVITDQVMPKMTGDALALELTKIRPGIPIILCTGYKQALSDEAFRSLGVREIIFKPLDPVEFPKVARRILDQG